MMARAHPPGLPGIYPRSMIDLGSIMGLYTHDHY
jgi:hypothetical protein